jgi:BA14K-like protein
MISLKVLSTVAAMALVLPMVTPTESFAQQDPHRGAGAHPGGRPGGGIRPGGGGPRFNGGGYRGGYRGGGGGAGALIGAGIAGAVIGGAIASQGYGPGYYAPAPGYYNDPGYDDGGPVAVAPSPGSGDAVAYCMQTYRSYDPQSGTYMGNDGYRHPCP